MYEPQCRPYRRRAFAMQAARLCVRMICRRISRSRSNIAGSYFTLGKLYFTLGKLYLDQDNECDLSHIPFGAI